MQDSLVYLISMVEEGNAEQRDIDSIAVLLETQRVSGRMDSTTHKAVSDYVTKLLTTEER